MKISLIHPSRSRAHKAFAAAIEWVKSAGIDVEYRLSIDESDPNKNDYLTLFEDFPLLHAEIEVDNFKVSVFPNTSVVQATNQAASDVNGDILIYLSDDFKCFPNWGQAVIKEFEGVTEPMLIKVDDCLQGFHVPVLTIPIMNRALYEKLGYFWHPGYKSMFVDEDLYWTAKKLGALKMCPHLKFEHQHVSVGKAEDDETYRNSAKNWDQGKALFQKRKAAGFPL